MGQSTINQKKIHRDGVNYRVQQGDRSDVDADALEENDSVLGRCSSHCMDACSNDLDVIRYCNVGCLLQNCNKIMDDEVKRHICSKECSSTHCNPKHFKKSP
ncbi:hypothetical protein D5086_005297 [Populus alba]|uniref:Uncharacterized protein n=1 Tax=Populus alba TaxID=43335 RepID=A0ACC4CT13_POPAL